MLRAMKVFVTGGTGYVGSHLVPALKARGHQVTILTHATQVLSPDCVVVRGDLRDRRTYEEALNDHDALIHNALLWGDERAVDALEDPRATIELLAAARTSGVRHVLYTSSTAVHRPFAPSMRESDAIHPVDAYAMTKAMSELAVWTWAQEPAQENQRAATIVRAGPVVGAPVVDGPFKPGGPFEQLRDAARAGLPLRVARNDGRQFIAARDVAEVYARALEGDGGRRTLLAVSRDLVTWEEIARAIVARVGRGEVVVEDTGLAPEPFVFDTQALEDSLGLVLSARDAVMEHIAFLTR